VAGRQAGRQEWRGACSPPSAGIIPIQAPGSRLPGMLAGGRAAPT
jgi:hypothetical protein